jgi:hypothetical protein
MNVLFGVLLLHDSELYLGVRDECLFLGSMDLCLSQDIVEGRAFAHLLVHHNALKQVLFILSPSLLLVKELFNLLLCGIRLVIPLEIIQEVFAQHEEVRGRDSIQLRGQHRDNGIVHRLLINNIGMAEDIPRL